MTRAAARLAATALVCAVAAGGCGVGPGEAAEGEATLVVTRDFGAEPLASGALEGPTPSDTVVRFLDEHAEIETAYGDNFVSAINGIEGSTVGGGDADWFYFVNGIWSDIGAGEAKVHSGDRIWWDHRRWAEAYRVPAVVGSWPEPFLHGYDDEVRPVVVECLADDPAPCETVGSRLADAGVDAAVEQLAGPEERPDALRILVGPWHRVRSDRAARQLENGPSLSGVYARIEPCASTAWSLAIMDADGRTRQALGDGGLIAAVRRGEDEPTWVVTAGAEGDLAAAAEAVGEEDLTDRYAVATRPDGESLPVPAGAGAEPIEEQGCR